MPVSFKDMLDAAYEDKALADILNATPAALQGVSEVDAEKLKSALGIKSIEDLAKNKFIGYAQALLTAAGWPNYDPGPPPAWQDLFSSAPLEHYLSHPKRFRLEFGPVYYRGRLDGTARVLIVGQDPSTNEILAHRIFVGQSGQRVQGILNRVGITRSYIMLNTFLFSVYGQFDTELKTISMEPEILSYRNKLFDYIQENNNLEAVITFGNGAKHAVDSWLGRTVPVFNLIHPAADEDRVLDEWGQQLAPMSQAIVPDDDGSIDTTPYGLSFSSTDQPPIPKYDIPFGVPEWHHRGGGHSVRDGKKKIIWSSE